MLCALIIAYAFFYYTNIFLVYTVYIDTIKLEEITIFLFIEVEISYESL